MHTIIKSLIQHVLFWLHDLTSEQWSYALTLAHQAEIELTGPDTGAQKKAFVIAALKEQWPTLKAAALNSLVELAASFIRKV